MSTRSLSQYGYPGESAVARLIPASDFMTRVLVDKKLGRPHTIRSNLRVCRTLIKDEFVVKWWAEALVFDALIGNTDRHPDNWGFLFRLRPDLSYEIELAPIFDNGTSLGYEVMDDKLLAATSPARIQAYIARGTHHCGWDSDGPAPHFELCKRFLLAHKNTSAIMQSVIRFDQQKVASAVEGCTRFNVGIRNDSSASAGQTSMRFGLDPTGKTG